MTGEEAHAILSKSCAVNVGKFYGSVQGVGLGAGLIYAGVRCPLFDEQERLFLTYESTAYVVTHECDVDEGNDRPFSEHVLLCPLILIKALPQLQDDEFADDDELRSFLEHVARRNVQRLVYLPPGPGELELGALAYLNNITNTHVSAFDGVEPIAAVSGYGLQEIDYALQRLLLRPKADSLSFMPPKALADG